jgi:hypothetical protein
MAICWTRFLDGPPRPGRYLSGPIGDSVLDGLTPSVGAVAIERSLAPLFDERFEASEDVEWWLRVAQVGSAATIPKHGYLYRRHEGVRHRSTHEARIEENVRILDLHGPYFEEHPSAAAFRWMRIGLMAERIGYRQQARAALRRSLRIRPRARVFWHLLRLSLPARDGDPQSTVGRSSDPKPRVPLGRQRDGETSVDADGSR